MAITSHILIASDHAGLEAKALAKQVLDELGIAYDDLGTHTGDSVDYPDFGYELGKQLGEGKAEMGLLICGSGIGISIAANRLPHVRCALCHSAETASLARQHNDANVLALGARVLDDDTISTTIRAFFTTEFEGGRHAGRVEKLSVPITC